jgi:hypothetical protein
MGEVIDTRGRYRVVLRVDEHAEAPYDEGSSPILRVEYTSRGWRAELVDKTGGYAPEHIDAIVAAASRFGGDTDLFERYLRMFHGTRDIVWYQSREGASYVTFDTPDWRAHLGIADDAADVVSLEEWRAYVEGDVYGWVVEERATWHRDGSDDTHETWEHVESCWGFYGREYAEEAAREAFAAATSEEGK